MKNCSLMFVKNIQNWYLVLRSNIFFILETNNSVLYCVHIYNKNVKNNKKIIYYSKTKLIIFAFLHVFDLFLNHNINQVYSLFNYKNKENTVSILNLKCRQLKSDTEKLNLF